VRCRLFSGGLHNKDRERKGDAYMESRVHCLEGRRHTNREVDRSELNSNKSHNHKSDRRTIQEHCATYKRVELQVDVGEG